MYITRVWQQKPFQSVWMKKRCQWWTYCPWLVWWVFLLKYLWNLFILIYSFNHFTIFYSIIQRLLYAFSTVSVFNVAQPAMRMRWFYYLFKQRFCSDIFYSIAVKASHFCLAFFLCYIYNGVIVAQQQTINWPCFLLRLPPSPRERES